MCSARNYTTHWHTRPEKAKWFGFDRQSAKHVGARRCSTAPLRASALTETHLFVPPLSAVYVSVKYRPNTDAVRPQPDWCAEHTMIVTAHYSEFWAHDGAVCSATALQGVKVAGSIPRWCHWNFFHWYIPCGRTMALGLTQPLTEISTGNISWGVKVAGAWGVTTLPPSCTDCLEIWGPQTQLNHQTIQFTGLYSLSYFSRTFEIHDTCVHVTSDVILSIQSNAVWQYISGNCS